MKALVNHFIDLCLLRAKPQDLPASQALFMLTFLINAVVGLMLIGDARSHPLLALLESVTEAIMMLVLLRFFLQLRQLQARFLQTAAALMGSGLMLGLVALPLLVLAGRGGPEGDPGLAGMMLLMLVMWSMVVLGHILRHAFEIPLFLAVGLGVLYTLFSYTVMTNLFQVS